jgi:hypothetical protein
LQGGLFFFGTSPKSHEMGKKFFRGMMALDTNCNDLG